MFNINKSYISRVNYYTNANLLLTKINEKDKLNLLKKCSFIFFLAYLFKLCMGHKLVIKI